MGHTIREAGESQGIDIEPGKCFGPLLTEGRGLVSLVYHCIP